MASKLYSELRDMQLQLKHNKICKTSKGWLGYWHVFKKIKLDFYK